MNEYFFGPHDRVWLRVGDLSVCPDHSGITRLLRDLETLPAQTSQPETQPENRCESPPEEPDAALEILVAGGNYLFLLQQVEGHRLIPTDEWMQGYELYLTRLFGPEVGRLMANLVRVTSQRAIAGRN